MDSAVQESKFLYALVEGKKQYFQDVVRSSESESPLVFYWGEDRAHAKPLTDEQALSLSEILVESEIAKDIELINVPDNFVQLTLAVDLEPANKAIRLHRERAHVLKALEHQKDYYKRFDGFRGSRFCCDECLGHHEPYMIQDELWLSIMPNRKGSLCFDCVEKKLGRKLTIEDFHNGAVNNPIFFGYLLALRTIEE